MSWLTYETHAGEPVRAGRRRLTPFSKVLRIQIPGGPSGGLVWNRPIGVLVREADGQETMLHVRDTTRIVELLLIGAGLLGSLVLWSTYRARKDR